MKRFAFLFLYFVVAGCSRQRADLPDITVPVDSLLTIRKTEDALSLTRLLLANTVDDSLKAELYIRYGLCKESENNSDSTIYFFSLAAEIWERRLDTLHLMITQKGTGDNYVANRNFSEANHFFFKALQNCKKVNDSIDIYISICVSYVNQGMYDSVGYYVQSYLPRYEHILEPARAYHLFWAKGAYFNSKKQCDTALFFLQKALDNKPDDAYRANTFTMMAEVYNNMHNCPKALAYLDSAGSIYGDEEGWDENKQFDLDAYRKVYDSLGKYDSAYYYAQLYRQLSDSIYDAKNNALMVNASANVKTTVERAKREQAEAENKLKGRSLIFSFIGLGLVALLAFVGFRNVRIKQKANQLLAHQKQEVQQLADQLAIANNTKARLFSTIGHDLRSPVSSLYASLKMQELKGNAAGGEMSEQTVRLLDTLEELLIWSKSQMDGFKVQPVKVNLRYFFEDLSAFYTNAAEAKNISIVNNTSKEVVIRADENLLKTIFRNAISNAIANAPDGSTIQLTAIQTTNGNICASVINPCCEESFQKFKNNFDDAAIKSGAYGLGIVLMKEFAQKLGGKIDLTYMAGNAILCLYF